MRLLGTSLIHSIKDQVRGVRYSIRAEAEAPGSALPRFLQDPNLRPLIAIGAVVGTPALRVADGIMTQVETVTTGMLHTLAGRPETAPFPQPLANYVAEADGDAAADFASVTHDHLSEALRRYGARNMLVSEQALDGAWSAFRARDGDLAYATLAVEPARRDGQGLVRLCAGLTVALITARPIKRVEFDDSTESRPRHLLLAPNIYAGLVAGLATALVTVRPGLAEDRPAVLESADAAVDARFARFKEALDAKDPAAALAAEFQAILPFLP